MPSSSSSVEAESPPEDRRTLDSPTLKSSPSASETPGLKTSLSSPEPPTGKDGLQEELWDRRVRARSFGSKQEPEGENSDKNPQQRKLDSLNVSPQLHHHGYGIPLGTPAAKEAAKSFWTMEQLKVSLDKIAQYAQETTGSQSPSLSSLGSSIESESLTFVSSGDSTPSVSRPAFSISPVQTQITLSAPVTPLCSSRSTDAPSPLLRAKKFGEEPTTHAGSLPSSPRLSVHPHKEGNAHSHLSPGLARRVTGSTTSRVSSAPVNRQDLKHSLSVEGKQMTLVSRNLSSPTFSRSASPPSAPLCSASYGGTVSPDDGFHE